MTDTVRALTCPQCGGTIALRAAGVSVTLVCEHCRTPLDATRDDVKVIAAAAEAMRVPEIALGTRGTLEGVQWEVIGYLERADGYVSWYEYLLFNPYEGYAFLVDDGRRFSLGRLLDRSPEYQFPGLRLGGQSYRQFGTRYDAWVTFVVGEFYWRVSVGETVAVSDYVRPGTMLSCEENGEERSWTRLALLDRGVAERAFGIDKRGRGWGSTPAPHEPSPYAALLGEAMIVLVAAFLALLAISFVGSGRQQVLAASITAPLDAGTTNAVLGRIDLPARYSRVTITADAPGLDNAWVDLDYSLVDRRTQESFDAYTTPEYYHGSDSDGPWREGDTSPNVKLASIPAGSYDLLVEAGAKRWTTFTDPGFWSGNTSAAGPGVPVTITVDVGGGFGGNIVLAMLLLGVWPLVLVFLHSGWEKRRLAPVTEDDE